MTFERWMEEATKGGVIMREELEEDSRNLRDGFSKEHEEEEEEAKILRLRKGWFGY